MTMANVAIDARGVTKWFGEGDARTQALREVSMQANFGEMLLIVGPSGSGKTTLLSVISGILRPESGSVSIDGIDLWAQPNDAIADFRLNRIGFVFQDYHLFPKLTTAENVAIPLVKHQVLNDTRCIVIVTHDARIFEYADRILRMEDGKLNGIDRGGAR
ncbi:ABC transporter ATP-binding protein [Alcaligenes phenolicus]